MASEKGDLPHDTDSLPPHYATSEAYSDSPPPAYRKTSTVRLQITRMVCATILTAGLLIGVFSLAHTYVTRPCDCSQVQMQQQAPAAAALVQHAAVLPLPGNDLTAEQPQPLDVEMPAAAEETIEEGSEEPENTIEEESDNLQNLDNEPKNVKLPVNMLLGNPALAGKDVQCKVEKKIQNLGNGIFSKTIMVTCEDDGKDDEDETIKKEMPSSPFNQMGPMKAFPRPPISMLAPVLRMMAARANSRRQNSPSPKILLSRMPLAPFPRHFGKQLPSFSRSEEPSSENEMRPLISEPPMPFPGFNRFSSNIRPIRLPFLTPMNDNEQNDRPRNMLFREDLNRQEPVITMHQSLNGGPLNRFPQNEEPMSDIEDDDEEEVVVKSESPMKVVRGFPPQIPEAIKDIISNIMKRGEESGSKRNMPVIAIKAIPQAVSPNDNPHQQIRLPFPFRPVKISSPRAARKLELGDEEFRPINSPPFPLPRGAIPSEMKPVIMPEAGGRALESPVTIPSAPEMSPMRFFPGGLVRIPVPLRA